MPRSNSASAQHAINVLIACVTQLTISFRCFLEAQGITEGPALQQLVDIETVLPTVLNLRREQISDTEIESLLGKTRTPITAPSDTSMSAPVGGDNVQWAPE